MIWPQGLRPDLWPVNWDSSYEVTEKITFFKEKRREKKKKYRTIKKNKKDNKFRIVTDMLEKIRVYLKQLLESKNGLQLQRERRKKCIFM